MRTDRQCTKCGGPIPVERIEALPETRVCEDCDESRAEPDFRTVRPRLEEPPRPKKGEGRMGGRPKEG